MQDLENKGVLIAFAVLMIVIISVGYIKYKEIKTSEELTTSTTTIQENFYLKDDSVLFLTSNGSVRMEDFDEFDYMVSEFRELGVSLYEGIIEGYDIKVYEYELDTGMLILVGEGEPVINYLARYEIYVGEWLPYPMVFYNKNDTLIPIAFGARNLTRVVELVKEAKTGG